MFDTKRLNDIKVNMGNVNFISFGILTLSCLLHVSIVYVDTRNVELHLNCYFFGINITIE